MKYFGDPEKFALAYQRINDECFLKVWVHKVEVCGYFKQDDTHVYRWNIGETVEWLRENLENILTESDFPLPIKADNSIEFYRESGNFESEDDDEFYQWYDKRQEWFFRHSWYVSRSGSYLPDIFFRRKDNQIEIQWDNEHLYDGVEFINPKGIFEIDPETFKNVITNFIEDYIKTV